ncbi:DUF5677 domain-containing protein [Amycolatopsis sp. lyj-108]|uniref:DUF5677 domain-containing protein n=1 Tax=Amycolatopsis sp. lyj-108 TaxID=2789286 RepID=UPI00397BF2CF
MCSIMHLTLLGVPLREAQGCVESRPEEESAELVPASRTPGGRPGRPLQQPAAGALAQHLTLTHRHVGMNVSSSTPPDEPTRFSFEHDPSKLIDDEAPWFNDLSNEALVSASLFARSFFGEAEDYPAIATVYSQGFSDLMSLFEELRRGSGRSAVRSARSLIEHAVNIRDIESSPARAQRYMDHLAFGAQFANDFTLGINLLSRSRAKRIRSERAHALKKLRPKIQSALTQYGSRFRSTWSEKTLADRSGEFGLAHLYPAYRLASLVIHGAPGGALGLVKQIQGSTVHRTGSAIHLCPFAYISGIEAAEGIFTTAGRQRPDLDQTPFLDVLKELRSHWPAYLDAINKVDNRIWPKIPPRHVTAILAVSRNGSRRWYWHDPENEILIESTTPNLTDEIESRILTLIDGIQSAPELVFTNGREYATISFAENIKVTPKQNAPILDSTTLMISPEEAQGMSRTVIHPDGRVEPW